MHLKVNHKVRCPYKDCNFESHVYSTFKAHIVSGDVLSDDGDAAQEQMSDADDIEDIDKVSEVTSDHDLHDLHVKDANCFANTRECCARHGTTALANQSAVTTTCTKQSQDCIKQI